MPKHSYYRDMLFVLLVYKTTYFTFLNFLILQFFVYYNILPKESFNIRVQFGKKNKEKVKKCQGSK